MKILILDDMWERHDGFAVRYAGHEIIKAFNVQEAIKALDSHKDFDLIHLDHSLQDYEYFPPEENKKPRERTGMEVVDYILNIGYPTSAEMIVHSWDADPARMMAYRLGKAGYKVKKEPYKAPPNI
jgi:CheY-like chemotaxis protein